MSCQFLARRSPVARRVHLLLCGECRAALRHDAVLARGMLRLSAEPLPSDGAARVMEHVGVLPRPRAARSARWKSALGWRFMPAGSLTAVAALGAAGWIAYIDIDPRVNIPTPPMPAANAYRVLASAYAAIPATDKTVAGENGASSSRSTDRVGYALNNTPKSLKAAGMVPQTRYATVAERLQHHVFTLEEKESLLREYAAPLQLVRSGFALPYQAPPVRSTSATLSYLGEYRQLGRVLALEARVKDARGDAGGAMNSCLDAMELGAQIGHGSTLTGWLTGSAISALGQEPAWRLAGRLNAAQCRAAARRLEHIIAIQTPYAAVVEEEKWYSLAILQEILRGRNWRTEGSYSDRNQIPLIGGLISYAKLAQFSKQRIVDDFVRLSDQQIAEAKRPYRDISRISANWDAEASRDPVTAALYPHAMDYRFVGLAGRQAQLSLLAGTLALRAYELEHPNRALEVRGLVPEYLSAIPTDPFADGRRLRYRAGGIMSPHRSAATPGPGVFYSVGPDGQDNGGEPIRNYNVNGRTQSTRPEYLDRLLHMVTPQSHGDIVAGINTVAGNP
jgi:hypothetical protein